MPTSLLKPSDLVNIQRQLAVIDDVLFHIQQAERAGINVASQKATVLDAQRRLLDIKNVYFPGQ
jgi:hypothetical protein